MYDYYDEPRLWYAHATTVVRSYNGCGTNRPYPWYARAIAVARHNIQTQIYYQINAEANFLQEKAEKK